MAYEMRISDWSSDVCSSDLRGLCGGGDGLRMDALALHLRDAHGVHADPDDDGQDDHREGGKEDGAGHGRPSMNGLATLPLPRSVESRVGKECVSTCRSRGSPYHSKKKITLERNSHVAT